MKLNDNLKPEKRKKFATAALIFRELVSYSDSKRAFARLISEDVSDVHRWCTEEKTITARAIISICRLFNVSPHLLNPEIFPEDLNFVYRKQKG